MDYVAVAVLLLIISLTAIIYLLTQHKDIVRSNKMIAVICIVTILTIVFTWICTLISPYLVPIAYAPLMMVMVMMDKRL